MDIKNKTTRRALLGAVGATVAGGGIAYGVLNPQDNRASGGKVSPPVSVNMYRSDAKLTSGIDLARKPVMGSTDADLDVYYWSDFQCPFCNRFEQNTFPKLIREHVKTGDARVVFIEFPYIGDASMTGAVAAKCVWRQVREESPETYWAWHSEVFDAQEKPNSGWLTREKLVGIAARVPNLDRQKVESCLSSTRESLVKEVQEEMARAKSFGVRGTPAFVFYNPQTEKAGKLVGAQPYDRFQSAIENLQ
ncbi:DsbA family protein (plasmid) [Halorussus limi]|uniref:DsbA family protein n=1 Tax=Halorussus limi TaxID=2938695 RepID=A0A8U0I0M9_9EURY|nr:thioredoxin domain-containing protein [Halorussus limi]UPV76925.1 DsbA family protein [Halorussus limi]